MEEIISGLKHTLTWIFVGSSVAGLAHILWEGKVLPKGRIVGAILMSGFAGLIVGLLLWEKLVNYPALLTGVSLLSGIGGASTIDFLISILRKYALRSMSNVSKGEDKE